jgi:hypothetical protein
VVWHAGRQPGLDQGLGQLERRQRSHGCGLQDHGVAAGDRRPELVGDQVEGVVEGRDREHDADRLPRVVAAPLLAAGEGVEWDDLAAEPLGFLGGDGQGVDAAPRLLARLADRLGALAGDVAKSSRWSATMPV